MTGRPEALLDTLGGYPREQRQRRLAIIDPVCGMSVDDETAAGAWMHAGVPYLFCSVSCLDRFKEDPQGFLDLDASQRSMAPDADGSTTDPRGRP